MKILTFYSFKGGVGRTALLMHLAIQWADRGRVVAVVDMDLNAPGLSFHPRLAPHENKDFQKYGTSNLLATFYANRDLDEGTFDFFPPSKLLCEFLPEEGDKWGSGGRLLALPAGTTSLPQAATFDDIFKHEIPPPSPSSVDGQEKQENPEQRSLRAFAKLFRNDLEKFKPQGSSRTIDYLLIDCRTGYPELADLAMGYLANRIILVSGLNEQNLEGLSRTLATLRPGRIPPGRFATDTLVVFSPIPAHLYDSPESMAAIDKGIKILEGAREPMGDQEPIEKLPPVYTLPYTPHLAVSDMPVSRKKVLGRTHRYWEAIYEIAAVLVPEDLPEEITSDLNRKLNLLVGLDIFQILADRQKSKALSQGKEALLSPASGNLPLAEVMRVPKWHWPLAGNQDKIDQWYAKLSEKLEEEPERERHLDNLCASISLASEEKLTIINKWSELSKFQKDSLLEIFSEEQVKFASLDTHHGEELLRVLARGQHDWARLVLEDKEAGDQAMLHWPLEGRQIFAVWESFPEYWFWLVETLTESSTEGSGSSVDLLRTAMLRETLPPWGRWAALTKLENVTHDEIATILKLVLDHPLPELLKVCLDLVRFIQQRSPALITMVEPVLMHLKRLADKDSSGSVWNSLGNLLCDSLARYDEAETAYLKALELDAQNAIILGNFANFMWNVRHSNEEAEKLYRQAIEADPKHAGHLGNFANFMCDVRHSYEEAEKLYRQAIELDPNDATILGNFAVFMKNVRHNNEKAEKLYRRAIELEPNNANILGNFAVFMKNVRHNNEEAEWLYRRAIELEPNNASIQSNFSWFLLGQGRREEGLVWLEKALAQLSEVPYPSVEAECRFYQYALGPDQQRHEALTRLRHLFDQSTIHSPEWDFSAIIQQAQQNGHPEVAWLNRLAQVISNNHPPASLEPWPDGNDVLTPKGTDCS
ncbi:MAG: tetratricopeptide repeat protein [Magnetococcales bacterium]|nr:tetratricopeptide repeat protein [Magnetococcales bacterium]